MRNRIMRHYNSELQTTTQTIRATKYPIESTYSDLPCDLKINKGKRALINRPRKCKKEKDGRSPPVHSRKLAEHDNSTPAVFPAVSRRYPDRVQRKENPHRAKNQSDCRIRYCAFLEKKIKLMITCSGLNAFSVLVQDFQGTMPDSAA